MLHIAVKVNILIYTWRAKKTGPFLNVDNFAMVSGRRACDVSWLVQTKFNMGTIDLDNHHAADRSLDLSCPG